MATLEERVGKTEEKIDKIENAIMRLLYIQQKTEIEIQELKKEMKEFKDEMKDFKDEMKEFKDEMKDFKDEMKEFKDEMKEFKDEMKEFKDEMKEFKDEMRRTVEEMKQDTINLRKDMNKKWGEMANKLGTVVEDIIAPAVSPVIKKYFNCEVDDLQVRRKKKDRKSGLKDEFDVIAVSDECKTVFLVEVKSYPKVEYVNEFKNKKMDSFLKLFPEYANYKLVPIFASLRLEEDIVNYLTKNNIYAMAYKEWEYMDILNFSRIKK